MGTANNNNTADDKSDLMPSELNQEMKMGGSKNLARTLDRFSATTIRIVQKQMNIVHTSPLCGGVLCFVFLK